MLFSLLGQQLTKKSVLNVSKDEVCSNTVDSTYQILVLDWPSQLCVFLICGDYNSQNCQPASSFCHSHIICRGMIELIDKLLNCILQHEQETV